MNLRKWNNPHPSAKELSSVVQAAKIPDVRAAPFLRAMQGTGWDRSDLVGGFNPFEKYARQIGSFPQVGVEIQNI